MEPELAAIPTARPRPPFAPYLLTIVAALVGLGLVAHSAWTSSATYDEVTYLRVAAHWWRTGEQSEISRMGSPVTFWKLQQAPTLLVLDRTGRDSWVDHPIANQASLLRAVRLGSLWIWLAGLLATAGWARWRFGAAAMCLSAWVFALSPNLIAHGSLVTMEMPLVSASVGVWWAFDAFLRGGRRRWFVASGLLAGLAFSLKFTAVLYPPILALAWWWCVRDGESRWRPSRFLRGGVGLALFVALMLVADLVLTGFALIPLSEGVGSHPFLSEKFGAWAADLAEKPIPIDWVGFLNQLKHQRAGGPSYLLGETRSTGWWYYYPLAILVKVPLAFGLLVIARLSVRKRDDLPIAVMAGFMALAMLFSKRNYGLRYLLPLAPLAIVWVSAIAESGKIRRWIAGLAVFGYAIAVATVHPFELSYFNRPSGGIAGGHRYLADSNLDWGQGLRLLADLQGRRPEYQDLTFYYFGDTQPNYYGVKGLAHVVTANDERNQLPDRLSAPTRYLAVSTSLVWGPWGPRDYFRGLRDATPVETTPDGTIRIYDVEALGLRADLMPASR